MEKGATINAPDINIRIENVLEVVFAERGANYYKEDADLSSFFEYASKGIISLDRIEVKGEGDAPPFPRECN